MKNNKKLFIIIISLILIVVLIQGCGNRGKSKTTTTIKTPVTTIKEDTSNVKLLFKSGFEDGVILDKSKISGNAWDQLLRGQDQGFSWEKLLSRGSPPNRFTYLVSSKRDLNQFVNTRIETVIGRNNNPTKALFTELIKQDPTPFIENTRNQYGLYPKESDKQAYMRYWIKLQPDLGTVILPKGEQRSRQIMEWKETGPAGERADFRWNINIKRSVGVDNLYWWTEAQYGDLANSPKAWTCKSFEVPVPIDEWFLFEVFWKLDPKDGRVWAAANGETIVDYKGRTQKDSGLFVWWPIKVYTGGQIDFIPNTPGYKSIYQWVDDVEVYNDIPASSAALIKDDKFSCETFPESL